MHASRRRLTLMTMFAAVAIPVSLGGMGLRMAERPLPNPDVRLSPYRSLIQQLHQTMDALQARRDDQPDSPDWVALLPAPSRLDRPIESAAEPVRPPPVPLFDLLLGGIIWKEKQPYAYVNEQVVTIGEEVNGFRVAAIERNRVTFVGSEGESYISDFDEDLRNQYPGYLR